MTPDEAQLSLKRIRATARPLIFRTGITDYPISIWGTAFLVGYANRVFAITADHLVRDVHSQDVLISPAEGPTGWLSLSNGYRLIGATDDDPTEYDLIGYEVFLHTLASEVARKARLLHLAPTEVTAWQNTAFVDDFFLFGYLRDDNGIEYESRSYEAIQSFLAGRYLGISDYQRSVHRLEVQNPLSFASFAGLSGSPVISVQSRLASAPVFRFCGVAIRGTAESGFVHFIEASVVLSLIKAIIGHNNGLSSSEFIDAP